MAWKLRWSVLAVVVVAVPLVLAFVGEGWTESAPWWSTASVVVLAVETVGVAVAIVWVLGAWVANGDLARWWHWRRVRRGGGSEDE